MDRKHATALPRAVTSTVHANRLSTFEITPQSFVEDMRNVTGNEITSTPSPHMHTKGSPQVKQVKNAKAL